MYCQCVPHSFVKEEAKVNMSNLQTQYDKMTWYFFIPFLDTIP